MKNGLYEVPLLIEKDTKQHLHTEKIEQLEMPKILAKDYQVLLRKKLESLDKEEVMLLAMLLVTVCGISFQVKE